MTKNYRYSTETKWHGKIKSFKKLRRETTNLFAYLKICSQHVVRVEYTSNDNDNGVISGALLSSRNLVTGRIAT